jgi:transposase
MKRAGIEVNKEKSVEALRKLSRAEKNGRVAARILGIANILDGMGRGAAAKAVGMDRQTLCDWVHRYNKDGINGLSNLPKGRPPRCLTDVQEKEIGTLVSKPPEGNLVRWRCVDIQKEIKTRYGVELHERSVGKLLRRLGFRRISVRPIHPKGDEQDQEDFKKTLQPASQRWYRKPRKAK